MVHVLVVSSDQTQRAQYASALHRDGFHVETAASTEEALSLLVHHHEPRVVLVDVTMPANTLVGFLTLLIVTPSLRVTGVYSGVGDLPLAWREDITQLMREIDMSLIDVTDSSFPLSRHVARLALRLQAVV
jgi:CheY-like chemotaxis protein